MMECIRAIHIHFDILTVVKAKCVNYFKFKRLMFDTIQHSRFFGLPPINYNWGGGTQLGRWDPIGEVGPNWGGGTQSGR